MIEVTGNLWAYPAEVRVITTNGFVTSKGAAVMGRGCALEATKRFPGIQIVLGRLLQASGNHVHVLHTGSFDGTVQALVSFPVKHVWNEAADPELIERSCQELVAVAGNYSHDTTFVMPRPGCGNGRLAWKDVKPILERYLDDRFHVITWA